MKIKLLAVGTKMPTWVTQGYNEYARRMPSDMQLQLHEIGLGFRGKGADLQRAIAKEGEQMLASIPAQDQVIALDVLGTSWSTEQLAKQCGDWRMGGRNVTLLVVDFLISSPPAIIIRDAIVNYIPPILADKFCHNVGSPTVRVQFLRHKHSYRHETFHGDQ